MASVEPLGDRAVGALIEDMHRHGVLLDKVTLEKLAFGLRQVVGDEAADLILEEVMVWLDKEHSAKIKVAVMY